MSKFPHLPLFTDAYIADTRHLSASQHGAYLLLLMMAWRLPDCALPNDDDILCKWASMDKRTWLKNKQTVLSFWELGEDQKFRQQRLSKERKYVDHMVSKNSEAGKASALKRKEAGSTSVQQEANQNSTPIPIPIIDSNRGQVSNDKKDPKWEKISDDEDSKANPQNKRVFGGKVIRLREKDFREFVALAKYNPDDTIDRKLYFEELDKRDEWLADQSPGIQKNWFMSTKAWSKKMGEDYNG